MAIFPLVFCLPQPPTPSQCHPQVHVDTSGGNAGLGTPGIRLSNDVLYNNLLTVKIE